MDNTRSNVQLLQLTASGSLQDIDRRRKSRFSLKGEVGNCYDESMKAKRKTDQENMTKQAPSGFGEILNAVTEVAESTVNVIDGVVTGVAGLVTDSIVNTGLGMKKLVEKNILKRFLPPEYADETDIFDLGINRFYAAHPTKKDILRLGDVIFFSSAQHEHKKLNSTSGGIDSSAKSECNLLFGDGHHDMRCGVLRVDNPMMTEYLEDCFFRILAQESQAKSKNEGDDESDDEMVDDDDFENENGEIEDKTVGNSNELLKYGKEFYLMHVSSGKYLKAFPRVASSVERECTRLGLVNGRKSADCIFRFLPGFKGKDSGYVYASDMTSIVNDKTELMIHIGSEQSIYYPSDEQEKMIEVNLASISTEGKGPFSWRIGRYATNEELDGKCLLVGEPVRLCHVQFGTFLSASSRNCDVVMENRCPSYRTSLKPPKWKNRNETTTSAKDIFIIERPSRLQGGAVQWKKPYRFRHLVSGCYLSVCPSAVHDQYAEQTYNDQRTVFMLRPRSSENSSATEKLDLMLATLFQIAPSSAVDSDSFVDMSESTVRIQHSVPLLRLKRNKALGMFMENSDVDGDKEMKEETDDGDENRDTSVNCFLSIGSESVKSERPCLDLIDGSARKSARSDTKNADMHESRKVVFNNIPSEGDVVRISRICAEEYVTLKFMMKCVSITISYERVLTKLFKAGDLGESVIIPEETNMRLQRMIEDLNNLLCCRSQNPDRGYRSFLPKSLTNFDKQKCIRRVQHLVKDSRLLDFLFYLLRLPSYIGIKWDFVRSSRDLSLTQQLVSNLISKVGADNPKIQVYASQQKYSGVRNRTFDHEWEGLKVQSSKKQKKRDEPSISFLGEPLQQLQVGLGASGIVEEYVTNNLWLLETLLDNKVLLYIVDLLKDRGPVRTLIDLLVSTCSCSGVSILGNQERLMNVIYSTCDSREFIKNRYNLLIETALFDRRQPIATSATGKAFQRVDSISDADYQDIMISWVGSEHFHPGKAGIGALYFDAATLGLSSIELPDTSFSDCDDYLRRSEMKVYDVRHWVCLHEVAWTVSSQHTPRLEEYSTVDEKLTRRLAAYYLSTLRMFSELCKSRSKKCIDQVKKQFSFDLLLVGAKDKKLPVAFRAAFTSLLHSAYVDVYPHEPMLLPFLVKVAGATKGLSEDSLLPKFVHPDYLADYVRSVQESMSVPIAKEVDRYGRNTAVAIVETKNVGTDLSDSNDCNKFNAMMDLIFDEFRDDLRPLNKKGGSPLENYRFCLVLLELSNFMLRSGFIYSMDKLNGYARLLVRYLSSHASLIGRPVRERKQSIADARIKLDQAQSLANLKRSSQMNQPNRKDEEKNEEKELGFGKGKYLSRIRSRIQGNSVDKGAKVGKMLTMVRSGAKNVGTKVMSEARSLIHDHESENGDEDELNDRTEDIGRDVQMKFKDVDEKELPVRSVGVQAKSFILGAELTTLCEAYDRKVIPEVVVDTLLENQRSIMLSWVSQPAIATRGPYSYPKSNPALQSLYDAFHHVSDNRFTGDGLPDRSWKWVSVWETKEICKGIVSEDPECWIYAFNWSTDFYPKSDATKFVRRRCWVRSRSLKTSKQIAEELIGESTSSSDLLVAFRSAIDSGEVTIDSVLACLARDQSQAKPLRRILTRQPALEDSEQQKAGNTYACYLNRCCCVSLSSLLSVEDICVDVRLTQFSNNFKQNFDKNSALVEVNDSKPAILSKSGEALINSMFSDVCTQLDFKKLESGRLVASLIQVIMSEDADICNSGLQAICSLFCTFSRTCDRLNCLQLLINKPAVDGLAVVVSCIGRLRNTTFSFVRASFNSSESEEIKEMCIDLDSCFKLLGDRICPSSTTNYRYKLDVQNALRKHGAHIMALAVLQHSLQSDDAVAGAANELTNMRRSAALFLSKLQRNNPCNQQLISAYLPLLLATLDRRFGTANILLEMHRDNFFLSQLLPEELVVKYFDIIDDCSVEVEYLWPMLDLLKNCLVVNGCPIKQNQGLILRHLLNGKYKHVCVTFVDAVVSEDKDETMTAGYQKRLNLVQDFDINTEDRNGKLLIYHSRVVELLALCCAGKNAACEIKCQQKLPLAVVLAVLSDPTSYGCPYLINGFAKYFYHAFLDVSEFKKVICNKIDSIDIETSPVLWIVLDKFATLINQYSNQISNELLADTVFEAILPTYRAYFSSVKKFISKPVEVNNRNDIDALIMENIRCVMQSFADSFTGLSGRRKLVLNKCCEVLGISTRAASPAVRIVETKTDDVQDEASLNALREFDRFKEYYQLYNSTLKESSFLKSKQDEEFNTLLSVFVNSDYILSANDGFNLNEVLKSSGNCKFLDTVRKLVDNGGGLLADPDADQSNISKKGVRVKFSTLVGRIIKHIREMTLSWSEKKKGFVDFAQLKDLSSTLQDEMQSSFHLIHCLRLFTAILSRINVEEMEEIERKKQLLLGPDVSDASGTADDSSFELLTLVALQNLFIENNAAEFLVDIVSASNNADMVDEALLFGTCLLEGGNQLAQDRIFDYLTENRNTEFFGNLTKRISEAGRAARSWYRWKEFQVRKFKKLLEEKKLNGWEQWKALTDPNTEVFNEEDDTISRQESLRDLQIFGSARPDLIFRLLQLFCEGHNFKMQNLIRSQTGFSFNHDLVEAASNLLTDCAPSIMALSMIEEPEAKPILQLLDFLIEAVQGPCAFNQEQLADGTLVQSCCRLLEFELTSANGLVPLSTVSDIRIAVLKFLISLVEGRSDPQSDPVYNIIVDKLPPSLLRLRLEHLCDTSREGLGIGVINPSMDEQGFLLLSLAKQLSLSNVSVLQSIEPRQKLLPFIDNIPFEQGDDGSSMQRPSSVQDLKLVMEMASIADPSILIPLNDMKNDIIRNVMYRELYSSLSSKVRSIEVSWDSHGLVQVFFPLPVEFDYMSEDLKTEVKSRLDFSDDDRVKDLLQMRDEIYDDISYKRTLSKSWIAGLALFFMDEVDYASLLLSIVINFLLIVSLRRPGQDSVGSSFHYTPESMGIVVNTLGVIFLLLTGFKLSQSLLLSAPLVVKRVWREQQSLSSFYNSSPDMPTSQIASETLNCFSSSILCVVLQLIGCLILYGRYGNIAIGFWLLFLIVTFFTIFSGLRDLFRKPFASGTKIAVAYSSFYDIIMHSKTRFRVLFFVCAILALGNQPYFYGVQLLAIIQMSPILQNVVKAVTIPWKSLVLSAILGVIAVYIFAIIGFSFLSSDFENSDTGDNECQTLILCFASFLHNGLSSSIGDYINGLGNAPNILNTKDFSQRLLYDLSYFVIVIVLMLNIIFGIIIDTFSALREEAAERERVMSSYCFVCGLSKDLFDEKQRKSNSSTKQVDTNTSMFLGYQYHIRHEHNMWDYVAFAIHLKLKDSTEYTGVESYVAEKIGLDDLSWIPKNACGALKLESEEEEDKSDTSSNDSMLFSMKSQQTELVQSVQLLLSKVNEDRDSIREMLRKIKSDMNEIQQENRKANTRKQG